MALPSLQGSVGGLSAATLPSLESLRTALSLRLPSLFGEPKKGGRDGFQPGITPERQRELEWELARKSGQFIETLGLILDTPGAIARGVLAGDPGSGLNFDADKRVSGAELLESYGIKPENPYAKAIAGLGAEIVTDPLFWISGPTGAVSKAGFAAKEAGILKNAPLAYMQKYGTDAAEGTMRGKFVTGMFDDNFVPKTAGNYQAVSPVGQRLAQSKVTLEDVVNAASDPGEALKSVVTKLGRGDDALGQSEYARLKGDTLGGLFGINVGDLNVAFNPPGSSRILDAMDALGARTRFSAPGRVAAGLFDKRVEGTVKAGDQINALRASTLEAMYREAGQREATRHNLLLTKVALPDQAKQLLGADSLYSPQGNDMLVRLVEGKGNATDQQVLAMTPGLQDWLNSWESIAQKQFAERDSFGLAGGRYKDKYGVKYNPRYGDEFEFDDMERGTGRMLYTASEAEAYGRKPYLITPGGTDDLRQISLLPEIIEYSKPGAKINDQQAAQTIMDWFAANHPAEPIKEAQAIKIARVMARRAQDLPEGTPVFAAHPANTQARRIINHEIAKSRAAFLLEALSEAAVPGSQTQQAGRYRNLGQSWQEIASKAGFKMGSAGLDDDAVNAMRASLSQVTGTPFDQIDLTQFSVAEPVVRRLQKIADFYSEPAAQKEVSGFLDGWTKLFKGFVLATPRRFVRDAYSNAVSGFLETGSATRQLSAMWNASKIVNGDYASAMPALRAIPKYAGLGSDEAVRDAFIMDVGGHGVLSGLQTSELLSSARTGEMGQLIPGSTPISIGKGLAELVPDATTSTMQRLKNFKSIYGVFDKYDTQNPILRASSTINDTVDSVGRLGTFIALMQQGVDPGEAAARVKRALVDYQSLTLTERKWLRSVFPWWAYTSRIGKYAADSLMTRPGGLYGQMIRASNTLQKTGEEDAYIPENLRQRFAVRLPDEWTQALGIYQPDNQTYITDIDLPGIDVLNLIDPYGVQGTINNLATQTSPPIQAGMSLATGRDLFFDRPLDETTTPADRVYKALTGSPQGMSPTAKVLAGLIPGTQVPMAVLGTLADERIEDPYHRFIKAGVNYASGLKEATVTKKYIADELARKAANELRGKAQTFSKAFIPDELVPTLTPYEQDIVAYQKIKDREALKMRQQEKAREAAKANQRRAYQYFP